MPHGVWGKRRTWGVVALAIVVVGVVAYLVVTKWLINDSSEAVSTEEILDQFRASTLPVTTTTVPPPTTTISAMSVAPSLSSSTTTVSPTSTAPALPPLVLPDPGVYRYVTTGSEHIDALDGATHDYPAETTITITPDGCGVKLRWDALRERHDEWRLCVSPGGIELQGAGAQYHEFFNQPEDEAIACEAPALLISIDRSPIAATPQTCTLADDPWLPTWETLERSTRTVEGAVVDVTHVRMTIADEDEHFERTTIDWYLTDSGLPVEVTALKSSSSPSPIGDVHYDEQYQLTLESLTPLT